MNHYYEDYLKINLPFCDYETSSEKIYNENIYSFHEDTMSKIMAIGREHYQDIYTVAVSLLIQNYIDYDDLILSILTDEKSLVRVDNREDITIMELINRMNQTKIVINKENSDSIDVDILIAYNEYSCNLESLSPYELIFDFSNIKNRELIIKYNSSIINPNYIDLLANNLEMTLLSLSADLNAKKSKINYISYYEQKMLCEFNDTDKRYNNNQTIYYLFTSQVALTPDQIALKFGNRTLTYSELFKASSELASELERILLNRREPIGVYINRSIEMIIAMFGIMKVGCPYVPLDPNYPDERIDYIISRCQMNYVLTHNQTNEKELKNVTKLNIENLPMHNRRKLETTVKPKDLAYIIFTSGSTGNPKGVLIEHRQIVNTLQWRKEYYRFSTADSVLQLPSFSFDSSVEDIFTPLISGATLVLINDEERFNISSLQYYIEEYNITHLMMLPSYYRVILNDIYTSLEGIRSITLAGEAINKSLVEDHFNRLPNVKVYSECGPTEASVCANVYEFDSDNIRVLLGPPIHNVKCHVVNRMKKLAPIGGIGECWIESPGVARGYLGQTYNERFIEKDEYDFNKSYKMYKSGDIVKWTYDGNIEFLGRRDNQVKVRGFRIEIGEVEKHILDTKCVEDVGIVVNEDSIGERFLEAFVVFKKNKNVNDLRISLAKKVPNHLIPTSIISIDKIKRLPNGKLDRANIKKNNIDNLVDHEEKYTPMEEKLHKIIGNIINRKIYSSEEPLEYYGITSLQIIKIIYDIEKNTGCKLTLTDIYQLNSINNIVKFIESQNQGNLVTDIDKAITKMNSNLGISSQYKYDDMTQGKYRLILNIKDREKEGQVIQFIDKNFDNTIYPTKIIYESDAKSNTDSESLYHETNIKVHELYSKLKDDIKSFNNELIYNKEEKKFAFNGMQSGHVMIPNRYTGDMFIINNTVSLEKIKTTIMDMIKSQILLRSRAVYLNGEWYWEEHRMPETVDIPFIDITDYSLSMQKEIINKLYEENYFVDYNKKYREDGCLSYTIILVKRAFGDYILLFFTDHIIYDQVSFEVIKKTFETFQVNQLKKDFSYYVSILEESLSSNGGKQEGLIESLNMTQFSQSIIKCYEKMSKLPKGQPTKYSIRFKYRDDDLDVFKNALHMYSSIISGLTGSNKLPVCMLSYGRKYGNESFHDSIGEFVDILPILVDVENICSTLKKLDEQIDYLNNNSISISTIIFNKRIRPLYKQFLRLFMPVSDIYVPNFLKFNFVGFKDMESDKLIKDILDNHEKLNYTQRSGGIVCEVFCLKNNEFLMEIDTDYHIEVNDIKGYIHNVCKDEEICIMEVKTC